MLTRQRQLGGQIAPGITLFPVFFFLYYYITTNDHSTQANLSEGGKKDELETADHLYSHRHTRQFDDYKASVNYFPIF